MKLDTAPVVISAKDLPEFKENAKSQLDIATIEPLQPVITESPKKQESAFVVFSTTFVTIFLAEIGDKTQLSTLLMSAESHAPWVVFLGSAAALISTSLLGVLLGSWIASRLSPKTVEKSAGVMLLLISVMLFWDVLQG
ncbi:TMEM165/GDT1 family protein [Nostoc sp. FACHB-280]|uniref:TMEM165/GDT1 family protein n=1 Tax=Nostoc sp. FACHB-280 TaxID=2692839 RepID=UPI00168B67CB|nr:TMEM165/GDT1 family protein [Nostoc sp. FACHB-280]MBD2495756.1 TMEM165/GDT1 family protein [Nostoc sp. FACHB-280]